MIYIVGCGKQKLTHRSYVKDMYTGSLFKAAYKYAEKRAQKQNIFIISAKYGLISINTVIAPYNEKMGINASITAEKVREQALNFGIINQPITILASKKYCDFLGGIFTNQITLPLKGLALGYSIQFLKRNS